MSQQTMTSIHTSPDQASIEKKYRYGPSAQIGWVILMAASAGILSAIMEGTWKAWDWTAAICFLTVVLPFAAWLGVWRALDKRSVMISKEGVYIPASRPFRFFEFDKYTFVAFSEITGVSMRGDEVNNILCIRVADKSYEIHSWFLRSSDDFQEIVESIQARMPSQGNAPRQPDLQKTDRLQRSKE